MIIVILQYQSVIKKETKEMHCTKNVYFIVDGDIY